MLTQDHMKALDVAKENKTREDIARCRANSACIRQSRLSYKTVKAYIRQSRNI